MVVTVSHAGLREAQPAHRVPRAAARRSRQDRRGDEGGRLRLRPLRGLAPTPTCWCSPPGASSTGSRCTRSRRPAARRAGKPIVNLVQLRRGREARLDPRRPRSSRRASSSSSSPGRASSRRPTSTPSPTCARPASSPWASRTATRWWRCASPTAPRTSCSPPRRACASASRRRRCAPWAARPTA